MKAKSGRLIYEARAFQQDATEAMRGDIVRALIETITNADDAYGEKKGKIRVELEHCHGPWHVVTRDRATGMRSEDMEEKIVSIGARTSGFEVGKDVRGNLGRGAKDLAAFGRVVFDSICDDRYSKLILKPTGEWDLDKERRATEHHRKELGIPRGNGTVVTMLVNANIRCPRHDTLARTLATHFQLRDILSDSRREVHLVDMRKKTSQILRYEHPNLPEVFSEELSIEGYPDAKAIVRIYRNKERYDDPVSEPGRPAGLLIKGKRAIYENSLFAFEANPHAGWFSGRVECRYIDELAREYDDKLMAGKTPEPSNPLPIIRRGRDGLYHNHPFYKALAAAVEKPLGALVAAEEDKARKHSAHESARMRRSLDALGRDLARELDEDLREVDEEGLPGDEEGSVPHVQLIPENPVLYMGEDKTLTVRVRSDLGLDSGTAEVDPGGVVEFIDGTAVSLKPHKRRKDVVVGQVRLRPLLDGQETLLTVTCGGFSAVALAEVRAERETVIEPVEPPDTLQFERDNYRVAWTKKKPIRVIAPPELIAKEGKAVRVTSSDVGVVVLGVGGEFELDDELEYYVAKVIVEARTLGAKAKLTAQLGSITADCNVVVAKDEGGPNIQIRIVDEEAGHRRALVERDEDKLVIKIMGRHPAIKRYLGPAPKFPYQDRTASKALVAEIVAAESTRILMERKFHSASGTGLLDAASLYVEHSRYMSKYLNRCHRALVGDADLGKARKVSRPVLVTGERSITDRKRKKA
ncbi:MAG: hypothetical protein ACE5OQ_11925 [Woeseia sp.]